MIVSVLSIWIELFSTLFHEKFDVVYHPLNIELSLVGVGNVDTVSHRLVVVVILVFNIHQFVSYSIGFDSAFLKQRIVNQFQRSLLA